MLAQSTGEPQPWESGSALVNQAVNGVVSGIERPGVRARQNFETLVGVDSKREEGHVSSDERVATLFENKS